MKRVFMIFVFILIEGSLVLAVDFTDNDGICIIKWEQPDDITNLKGYRLELFGDFPNFIRNFSSPEPPLSVQFNYSNLIKSETIAILKVFSVDLNGKKGGFVTKSIKLIPPEAPKNLTIE